MEEQKPILKKKKIVVFIASIFILLVGVLVWQFIIKDKGSDELELTGDDAILFGSEPSAFYGLGETANLGVLEINADDAREEFYSPLELDENYKRIVKNYFAVQVKVFNPAQQGTENILVGLVDEYGNIYKPDHSVSMYVPDLKDFGKNRSIFPRIIQEGYLFFTGVDENAKEVQLVFALESTGEKIAFKINK